MEIFEAVKTVLAVRSFQDNPIPAAVTRQIIEAGRLTASSMNLQPWHFIVVENRETLKKLGELATYGPYTAQAAMAVVVVIEKSRFSVSDASRAIQSMVLTGWAEGVGSNWVGFLGLEAVNELLGIPDELDVLAIVPFGYPLQSIGKGLKKRKPLARVASRERFGQPFA
jgi:nitroreductase